MANTPTPEQQDIIGTLDAPLFVAAGAGSGKSSTLAERVAWALTPGSGKDGAPFIDSLDRVLVITYTHAAADEIREKIRARLRRDERLAHHALSVDTAWISTIHGMCIRILKAHAFDLGLNPELELISETRAAELLEASIDACVRDLARKEEYRALCAAFDIRGRASGAADAASTIVGMVKALVHAASSGVEGLASLTFPGRTEPLAAKLSRYLEACRTMAELIDEAGFNPNERNQTSRSALHADISAMSSLLAGAEHDDAAVAVCIDALAKPDGRAFSSQTLKDAWKELQSAYRTLVVSQALAASAPLRDDLVRLAERVEKSYGAAKAELGVVDNPDLLRMAHDAFERHPAIAALYGSTFKLVMVDEFQDTNEQQVQMIRALAGPEAVHLATVGDAQQSIYRFQGADVSVFNNRGASVAETSHRRLTVNFRSHADILSFVERTCAHGIIDSFMPLEPVERPASSYRAPAFPRISVELASGASGSDAARRRICALQLADRIQAYLDAGGSAGDVALLMGSLTHVQVYLDALRARGIACVVSGGSTFSAAPEVALVQALLDLLANPYSTQTGLYPVLTSEIFFCDANDICLLATSNHEPLDETDARAFDKRRLADGFLAYVEQGDAALPHGSRPSERLARAADVLGRALERARSWQLSDVLEGIVRESGWIARLEEQGPQGTAQAANVLAAIRFASELADRGSFGISRAAHEFELWLSVARQGLASLDTGAEGVVRVMTVHASKGLEFPVCAVAELWHAPRSSKAGIFCENIGSQICAALIPKEAGDLPPYDGTLPPSPEAPLEAWCAYLVGLHEHAEMAEKGRLLYVALTRAQEALILSLSVQTAKKTYAYGTNWSPRLASDAVSALFGAALPPLGCSTAEYGGMAPAYVRHLSVDKPAQEGDLPPFEPADALEARLPAQQRYDEVALFDPAVADGVAQTRLAARPWNDRRGTFSYSSVHALLGEQDAAPEAVPAVRSEGPAFHRASAVLDADEGEPAPRADDADRATDLGSAFHQLAQAMAECGSAPSPERIAAACRTWQLTRAQRARLVSALERWTGSSLRAETLSYALRRPEAPFFIAVESPYGTHLEGAIDLLCTDPGSPQALVVDYKTGDAHLTLEQIRARHALQAAFYASVLVRLGYESVECAFACVELDDGSGEPVVVRYRFDADNPPTFDLG